MWRWVSRYWLFVIAIILVGFAVWLFFSPALPGFVERYEKSDHPFEALLVAMAGWASAVGGILIAGKDAKHAMALDALLKLHDEEGVPKQSEAKRIVWTAAPPREKKPNPYSHVRQHVKQLTEKEWEELDAARRRLTHFWYRAARLKELGILTPKQIFDSVGPPEILIVLEPLEAILAEAINPDWQPRPWPPMRLLINWLKQQGRRKEAGQFRAEVPARLDLYKASNPPGSDPAR